MSTSYALLSLIIIDFTSLVAAYTTLGTSLTCVPGSPVSTAPNCDFFLDSSDACAALTDRQSQKACLCIQKIFNAATDCESELRLCFESTDLDDNMVEGISSWHSVCDTYITYSPTTPVLSTITSTYDAAFCESAELACLSEEVALDKCTTITDISSFDECSCQPSILRYDYTCQYLGNSSCLGIEAAYSNLIGYSDCPNFNQVIGGGIPAPTTVTLSFSTTSQASPGSSATTTSIIPTTTAKNSSASKMLPSSRFILYSLFAVGLDWILI